MVSETDIHVLHVYESMTNGLRDHLSQTDIHILHVYESMTNGLRD